MAENPIKTPLPADLPEDWTAGQIVAPTGEEVGLSKQHGYNYLMQMVNRAQQGVNAVGEAFETVSGKRTCRVVVGTSTAGWTEADCDFLCDGTDDQVEIQQAINSIPQNGQINNETVGEVVILAGVYNLSNLIFVEGSVKIRGNGAGRTFLLRNTVSTAYPYPSLDEKDIKNAIIYLYYHNELQDLSVGSLVNAPDAAQIYVFRGAQITNVNINTDVSIDYLNGPGNTGIGIYFATSSLERKYISNCCFGNVSTAIYLKNSHSVLVRDCYTLNYRNNDQNNKKVFPPVFLQNEGNLSSAVISGNRAMWSAIKINNPANMIISDNICSKLEVLGGSTSVFTESIIANNILVEGADGESGIFLNENTKGIFVTGNQVQSPVTNEYYPIVDSGTNNIVRFNSNDTSAGGTVGPAGPAGKGVPTGGASGKFWRRSPPRTTTRSGSTRQLPAAGEPPG